MTDEPFYSANYSWDRDTQTWVVELEGEGIVTYGPTLRVARHNIQVAAEEHLGHDVVIRDVLMQR